MIYYHGENICYRCKFSVNLEIVTLDKALFAITQLLCHVCGLLTSACKQALHKRLQRFVHLLKDYYECQHV